jgi:uncharacterized protein YukE
MTQAIVDPDEMRRFAAALLETVGHLQNSRSGVKSRFSDLKDTWRDQKYAEFERIFGESMAQLDSFLRAAEMYAHYLQAKARKADRFLESRY